MTPIDEGTSGLYRALGASERQDPPAGFVFVLNAPRHAAQNDDGGRESPPSESAHAVVCVLSAPARAPFGFLTPAINPRRRRRRGASFCAAPRA